MKRLLLTTVFCLIGGSLLFQSRSQAELTIRELPVQQDDTFKVFPDPAGNDYFPKGEESYYTRYLALMKEPSLLTPREKGIRTVFRFTYLRSFHEPLAVRVIETEEGFTFRAIRLQIVATEHEYRPVKIIDDETGKVNSDTTARIKELLNAEGFWEPLNPTEKELVNGGLDGALWIFEIHDDLGYRMLVMARPPDFSDSRIAWDELGIDPSEHRDFSPYEKIGEQLLKIGKILPKPRERY